MYNKVMAQSDVAAEMAEQYSLARILGVMLGLAQEKEVPREIFIRPQTDPVILDGVINPIVDNLILKCITNGG
jgi:hypothetical protein